MGYLRELIATEARYRRQRKTWQPHLDRTASEILKASGRVADRSHAVILGAGMAHDLPLKELAEQFTKLSLIDVCFSRAVRSLSRRLPGVDLVVADITGRALMFGSGSRDIVDHSEDLPEPELVPEMIGDATLVVSANVLSQLPLIPLAALRARISVDDPQRDAKIARTMIDEHLQMLRSCPGEICLISEIERQFCDGGAVVDVEDALYGADVSRHDEPWIWEIAPRPELLSDRDVRVRVSVLRP